MVDTASDPKYKDNINTNNTINKINKQMKLR